MPSDDNYNNGLKARTEVMGEQHVKRSLDSAMAFTQPLQDWIIEHAWGSIGKTIRYYLVNIDL